MKLDLESLFVKHAKIDASPLQRSILRAADGRKQRDVLTAQDVFTYFGLASSEALESAPTIIAIVAGIRGGKSFICAVAGIRGALCSDCSKLQPHEVIRVPIVAPNRDNAAATFVIVNGIVESSPGLRACVVSKTADTLTLRRPDGRLAEIVVVAAARSGITLRSRWLGAAIFEEVAFYPAESDGYVVNAEELLRAAEGRLLPGAQIWLVSSPNGPEGLLHALYRQHFGKPGRVLVVHAPTRALNPSFPQATIDAIRARDPDAAAREHDALWLDAAAAYLDAATVDSVRRAPGNVEQLAFDPTYHYVAAMDPATRGNAWSLVIIGTRARHSRVFVARQWVGRRAEPLSPKATIEEIAKVVAPYGIKQVRCDQWSIDANRDLAHDAGLKLIEVTQTSSSKWNDYESLRTMLVERRLELPHDPIIRTDLLSLRKVVTHSGPRIEAPRSPGGRHADFASSLALAVGAIEDAAPKYRGGNAAPPVRMPAFEDRAIGAYYDITGRGNNQDGQPDHLFSEAARQVFTKDTTHEN